MATTPLDRSLLNDNGAGLDWDLARIDFITDVLRLFDRRPLAWDLVRKKAVMQGKKSDEFIRHFLLTEDEHVPGAELDTQTLEKANLLVSLEDAERQVTVRQSIVDKFISHINDESELALQAVRAQERMLAQHTLRALTAAARAAAVGSFPTGTTTSRAGATFAIAYPMTTDGSVKFQENLATVRRGMLENDMEPDTEMFCFCTHRMRDVLRQDNSLLSSDYDGQAFGNSKILGRLMRVESIWIMPTNNMPQTDLSAETKPKIRGTTVYNVNNALTAGLIMTPESLAAVWTGGIMPYVDWLPERRSTNIGAATFKGINTFRPEASGEITITGV